MLLPLLLLAAEPAAVRATCPPASGPALLVEALGLKNRAGQVRVRVFGGETDTYFDKRRYLSRIEVPVPATGRVTFCMALPGPGIYAVDVRHDVNGNGKTDRADGGGASGDPEMSLFGMLFGRKPDPATVQVRVGKAPVGVPVTMKYLQGGAFRPWR